VSYFPHAFEGRIVHHDVGTYRYTVVFLPPDLAAALPLDESPRPRFSGEIGEVPFAGAWQPVRGRWYAMLSKAVLRAGGFKVGDEAEVRFRVEDPERVDVPGPFAQALAADPAAAAAFAALSAGKRRGLAHRVAAAKTASTAQRRVDEALAILAAGRPEE